LFLWSFILDLAAVSRLAEDDKDLEIMLLRQQLRIVERKQPCGPHLPRWQKVPLAALAIRLKSKSPNARQKLAESIILFKPETVIGWHRALVRRKWTFKQHKRTAGRPRTEADIEDLVVQMARDNSRWGYDRIAGELQKLGITLDPTTVKNILERQGIPPAPQRGKSSWRTFLNHYKQQMLACDFLTVETLGLRTVYILFFIELGTRRVHFAGCTAHPDQAWVTQQARQLTWALQDRPPDIKPMRFLIHDRDTKFNRSFNTLFLSEGIEIVLTPFRAPKANAFAERWIRSLREECFDHLLIINERHLRRVLIEYVSFYNEARPHQGLEQQIPIPKAQGSEHGVFHRRDILGGLLHDYYRQAA
jgi:transposase InsO family protein